MKTISLKKVSAVAVASLGFGLLSVVPAQAALTSFAVTNNSTAAVGATIGNITNTSGQNTWTSSVAVAAANVGKAMYNDRNGFMGTIATIAADGLTGTFTAVTTVPTTAAVAAYIGTPVASSSTPTGVTAGQISGFSVVAGTAYGLNISTAGTPTAGALIRARYETGGIAGTQAVALTAAATSGAFIRATAPTTVGTYRIIIEASEAGTFLASFPSADVPAAPVTFTLTVTAATQLAPASSIVRMAEAGLAITANPQTSDAAYTTTKDAAARTAAQGSAATRNNISQIAVILLNANGTAAGNLHTVTASVAGSGLVTVNNSGTASAGSNRAHSYTLTGTENTAVVHVTTDGTVGTGTITISVTDSVSGATTVIGTKTVTTYGAVAKLEVSTKNFTIGRAGFTTGKAAQTRAAATEVGNSAAPATVTVTSGTATTPAFIVKASDSLGQAVNTAAVPTIVSGTPTVVSGGTCLLDDGAATVGSSTNGVGFYNCDFATVGSATSGSKATLTIRVLDPADADGVKFLTTTIDVTVGGSVSTETIAFDKTAYAPGEGMTITRTAKDSAGNPVADGTAAPAITFSKAVGGTAPAASFYVGGTRSSTSSAGVQSVFAPSVSGAFTAIATSGNTAASALSAAASVTDANAGLLTQIDALNAKIVALNALIAKIMKKLGVK